MKLAVSLLAMTFVLGASGTGVPRVRPGPNAGYESERIAKAFEKDIRGHSCLHVVMDCTREGVNWKRSFHAVSSFTPTRLRTDVFENDKLFFAGAIDETRAKEFVPEWQTTAGTVGHVFMEYDTRTPAEFEHLVTVDSGVACFFGGMMKSWLLKDSGPIHTVTRAIREGTRMPDEQISGVRCAVFRDKDEADLPPEDHLVIERTAFLEAKSGRIHRIVICETTKAQGKIEHRVDFSEISEISPDKVDWQLEDVRRHSAADAKLDGAPHASTPAPTK